MSSLCLHCWLYEAASSILQLSFSTLSCCCCVNTPTGVSPLQLSRTNRPFKFWSCPYVPQRHGHHLQRLNQRGDLRKKNTSRSTEIEVDTHGANGGGLSPSNPHRNSCWRHTFFVCARLLRKEEEPISELIQRSVGTATTAIQAVWHNLHTSLTILHVKSRGYSRTRSLTDPEDFKADNRERRRSRLKIIAVDSGHPVSNGTACSLLAEHPSFSPDFFF